MIVRNFIQNLRISVQLRLLKIKKKTNDSRSRFLESSDKREISYEFCTKLIFSHITVIGFDDRTAKWYGECGGKRHSIGQLFQYSWNFRSAVGSRYYFAAGIYHLFIHPLCNTAIQRYFYLV